MRDVVEDNRVQVFRDELALRLGDFRIGFRCETDEKLMRLFEFCGSCNNIRRRRKCELEYSGAVLFLDFLTGNFQRREIGGRGGGDEDVAVRRVLHGGVEHLLRAHNVQSRHAARSTFSRRAGNKNHFRAATGRDFSERVAHFARTAIAQKTHGIEIFARRASGDEYFFACEIGV